jgi:hypothetical protein
MVRKLYGALGADILYPLTRQPFLTTSAGDVLRSLGEDLPFANNMYDIYFYV